MVNKRCEVVGCERPFHAHGMCSMHNNRVRLKGSPGPVNPLRADRNSRPAFINDNANHEDDGECLIWPFGRLPSGYGLVRYKGKMMKAHRAMCWEAHGEPPTAKHEAAHSCGRGHLGCVNPKHLRWATTKENQADRIIHGTDCRGEKSPHAVLKSEDVICIRQIYRRGALSYVDLAGTYGVHPSTIRRAVIGESWSCIHE
jgi:hypothetical protein